VKSLPGTGELNCKIFEIILWSVISLLVIFCCCAFLGCITLLPPVAAIIIIAIAFDYIMLYMYFKGPLIGGKAVVLAG
jgi:hypothetical protein